VTVPVAEEDATVAVSVMSVPTVVVVAEEANVVVVAVVEEEIVIETALEVLVA
jgi:hypothetical protein